jgi:hypothetical protein
MNKLSKATAVIGILVILYAAFSRFYGEPSVAMLRFKSSNILVLGNTVLLISLILKDWVSK